MIRRFIWGFIRYHRGLGRLPLYWKTLLTPVLIVNMFMPLFFLGRFEARIILALTLFNGFMFCVLTAIQGFTRLIWISHWTWIPLIIFLWFRLDQIPPTDAYGIWIRTLMVLDAIALVVDVYQVSLYLRGDRAEMVELPDDKPAKSAAAAE